MNPSETNVTASNESVQNAGGASVTKTIKMRKRKMGFTNMLAVYLVLLLTLGLGMAFYLARLSIMYNYMGQLLCFTVVFTPLGTAISLVLGKIVDKSKAENSSGDGTGIKFAQAAAAGFQDIDTIHEVSQGTQPEI